MEANVGCADGCGSEMRWRLRTRDALMAENLGCAKGGEPGVR